jgi:hypothetical protein
MDSPLRSVNLIQVASALRDAAREPFRDIRFKPPGCAGSQLYLRREFFALDRLIN